MRVLGSGARHVSYLLAVAGIILVNAALVVLVATYAAPFAVALVSEQSPRHVSLVEQRVLDAEAAANPLPEGAKRRVVAMVAPAQAAGTMAAQLDATERVELASLPRRPRQRFAFDDGISFPPAPPLASMKMKERPRRRLAYADLRGRRFAAHASPSAAEEFRRRFAPSFADAR